MKTTLKRILILALAFGAVLQLRSQGYIVPNGVRTDLYPGEIDVWNPNGTQLTGFTFTPNGMQQPTTYANIFTFNEPVTIGVRVFFVSPNDPVSLSPIVSQSYAELGFGNNYVLQEGVPFYVGLYTGYNFAPPYPPSPPYFYTDPVYGWAELENVQGVIQVMDYAVEYQGGGIYTGTQTIIPVPEPSAFALTALGGLLLGFRRWKR
jgi:hypothetical protein